MVTPLRAATIAFVLAAPASAQIAEPAWLHVSPLAGAVIASVPGDAPRTATTLQLEGSRELPIGLGVALGFAWPASGREASELAGPWAEGTLAYRFKLRYRGFLAPYAGPLLGASLHDIDAPSAPAGQGRWVARWHFGGRAGMDIPVGGGWPAVRVEIAYRNSPSAGGLGGSDVTTALFGFRWSHPLR